MRSFKIYRIIFFSLLITFTQQASAQKKVRKGTKETVLNFEDELIQGEAKSPELFYLLQKKQFNFKKLIRLRDNFLPEMRRTSEELQRIGGVD